MTVFEEFAKTNAVKTLKNKHYLILLVESIQVMDGSIFKHDRILGRIFPGFLRDSYIILFYYSYIILELSKDPNVIINHISILKGYQQHLDTVTVG